MFTGIIETIGEVVDIWPEGTNLTFQLESTLTPELKVDQSISHNGVCLTVVEVVDETYLVTAVEETLKKTTLSQLHIGSQVNLERCMPANGRFDGHIVQGHVDQTGICTAISAQNGSWLFDFAYDPQGNNSIVEKGSICLNGISLTVFDVKANSFRVTIIPYTFEHTTFRNLQIHDWVNIEFDIIGKYIKKLLATYQ